MKAPSIAIKVVLVSFLFIVLGCQQEEQQEESTGIVEATPSYLKIFGVPPQGKAGRAYATIGYLPVRDEPDKLGPVPIFLFTEEDQLEKVLAKLVSGDLITSEKQLYYNPFPRDLEIAMQEVEENILTIDLQTKQDWNRKDRLAGILALKETALQFSHLQRVKVILNGAVVQNMPRAGFAKNRDLIIETPPPNLILMAGAWEKGRNTPEEILIEFDRPVKVEKFHLYHLDGQEVQGKYYKSIFQMAVVIHPEFPSLFAEGTALRAEWRVADQRGRENSGIDTMQLIRYEH